MKEDEFPILGSTQRCDRHFEELLKTLHKWTTGSSQATGQRYTFRSKELVLDYKLRLQFWAGSVGVDDELMDCLDTQLRKKPDLRTLVLQLLQLVDTNLQRSKD